MSKTKSKTEERVYSKTLSFQPLAPPSSRCQWYSDNLPRSQDSPGKEGAGKQNKTASRGHRGSPPEAKHLVSTDACGTTVVLAKTIESC